jgi:hypothetical protein
MKNGRPTVVVFGASRTRPGDADYDDAQECGRLLGEAGCDVMTGGYMGSMEASSRGATAVGAEAIGVTAPDVFTGRSGANDFVTREIPAATLTSRIDTMIAMSDAAIALPGSIGTLTELMVAWNVAFVARFADGAPQPVVAVGERWARIIPDLAERLETDPDLVTCVGTVQEAVEVVVSGLGRQTAARG